MLDAELVELRDRARRVLATLKPIPLPVEPAETDVDVDIDGQCLRFAAAHTLRVPPLSLPRVPGLEDADRWERWTGEMHAIGYQVEELSLDEIPPADQMPWIAVIDSGVNTHAVGCVGLTVLHAPGSVEPRSSISPARVLSAFRFRAVA